MKKMMILCFCLLFTILSILSCVNFSYGALDGIEGDMLKITIEKPESISNENFLQTVAGAVSETGEDIMLRKVTTSVGRKMLYSYYKTNNSNTFLDVKSETGTSIVLSGECLSTKTLDGFMRHKLYTPSLLQDIAIFNWYEAIEKDLSSGIFFIRAAGSDEVLSALGSLGYRTLLLQGTDVSGKLPISLFAAIPGILLVVSFVFYSLSAAKKNVLRKADGFSNQDVFFSELKENALWIISCFTTIQIVTMCVATFVFGGIVKQFFILHIRYLLIGIGILLFGMLAAFVVISSQNRMEYVKGKVPQKGIYAISMLTKCAFIAFLIFFVSIGIRNIYICHDTYQNERFLADKVKGYVCMPIYANNASFKGHEDGYMRFYQETEQRYDGILVDANNFAYDLVSGGTMADLYGQVDITINENYLEFNPIYDVQGQRISAEEFSADAVNILIPKSRRDYVEKYTEKAQLWFSTQAEITFYDDATSEIYSYNAKVLGERHGKLPSPVIIIANDTVVSPNYITSCISTYSYFIRPHTNDAYAELYPLLKELGLENTTQEFPHLSESFGEEFNNSFQMLVLYGTQSLMLLLGLICLIFFSAKTFCENYRMRIALCLIEGYTVVRCCGRHIIINTIIYIVSFLIITIASLLTEIAFNYNLLVISFIADQVLTLSLCGKFSIGRLYSVVKGAE